MSKTYKILAGDVVKTRNGNSYEVRAIGDSLKRNPSDGGREWDILEIYRIPERDIDVNSFIFRDTYQTLNYLTRCFELVFEAKELVEELTLEQVCKELGRDIKIVKG